MKRFVMWSVTAAAVFALSGCGGSAVPGSADDKSIALIVGASAPLSGGAADFGTAFVNGIEMAAAEINEAGGYNGVDISIEVVTCDDGATPDDAAACARRMSQQDRASAIFVPGSYAVFPILAFNESPASPFLLFGAAATPAATEQGNKLFVRTWSTSAVTMPDWVKQLIAYRDSADRRISSVATLEVNTEYGQAWVRDFRTEWEAGGGRITGNAIYDANATDFYSVLTPLLRENPDAIALTTVCQPSTIVVKQARELGFTGTFINSSACQANSMVTAIGAEAAEGMVFESTTWDDPSGETQAFAQSYEKLYSSTPQQGSANGYAALYLYVASVAKEKDVDPTKLRAVLASVLESMPANQNVLDWSDLQVSGDLNWPMHVGYVERGKAVNFEG